MENTKRTVAKQKSRQSELSSLTLISAYVALALLLFYVEGFLPPLIPVVPFARLGLANIVSLVALYTLGGKKAFAVLITRCVLGALFMGNVFSLVYSLTAGVASFLVMLVLKKTCGKFLGMAFISVVAAITHNLVQVGLAMLIVGNIYVLALLPYLLIMSVISGIVTSICAKFITSKIYIKKETV